MWTCFCYSLFCIKFMENILSAGSAKSKRRQERQLYIVFTLQFTRKMAAGLPRFWFHFSVFLLIFASGITFKHLWRLHSDWFFKANITVNIFCKSLFLFCRSAILFFLPCCQCALNRSVLERIKYGGFIWAFFFSIWRPVTWPSTHFRSNISVYLSLKNTPYNGKWLFTLLVVLKI